MVSFRKSGLAVMLAAAVAGGFVAGAIINSPSATVQARTISTKNKMHHLPRKLRILFMAGRHLRTAERILHRGKPIYGGHRVAAMKLIAQAGAELKEAAEAAKGHHDRH